jgi:cell division protein FtsI/penicillin-binding protein 2
MTPSGSPAFALIDFGSGRLLDSHQPERTALPGSTVKPFLPASGAFACRGELRIGPHQVGCSHPAAYGVLSREEALAFSCNHYFSQWALTVSPAQLFSALHDFSPKLAVTEDQRRLQAIGLWGVSATPRRLALAYRRVARSADALILRDGKTGTTREGAWFAGWAPARHPRFVIAVMTGGSGAAHAWPAAQEILKPWLR